MDRKNIEINPLLEVYSNYIEKIDSALDKELELYSESEFCEPLKYALEGGKRIRPIITLLAAESVGKIDDNVYAGACAIELLHTESVIHDDIIDNETQRRHKDPFHIKYGYNTSVLTGDFVLGLILNISSRLDTARVTKDLATAAMLMSEGLCLRLPTSARPVGSTGIGAVARPNHEFGVSTANARASSQALSAIRVTVLGTNGVPFAVINEIRIYDEAGQEPFPAQPK